MKASRAPLVAALLVAGAVRAPAQPPSPIAATDAKPATISGRVTAADTGKPLRRARVTVSADGAPSRPIVANTNSAGFFEVKDVPPGSYYVGASRAGYLGVEYGQRYPQERGTALRVVAGRAMTGMNLSLPRGGVLAGRISDELNEAYPGVRVDVLAMRYDQGRRAPYPVSGATTDDLGQYRVIGLAPGSYYVVATSSETWRTDKKETLGYAATYYPGGTIDQAQIVTLGLSQQRAELNFSLQARRTARVRGRVVRGNGQGMPDAFVNLAISYPGSIVAAGGRSARTEADGSFEFKDVFPGVFSVNAGGGAEEIVAVNGVDIDGLTLVVKSGSIVTGALVTEDGPPPFPLSGVRIQLEAPDGNVLPTVRIVQVDTDGSFELRGLGGRFLFRVAGLPEGWMVGSVQFGDRDITDVPWDVPTGGQRFAGLKVVLTQKIGSVAGAVLDSTGKPSAAATVVLFSDEPELWMPASRFIRMTRPDKNGRFSVSGLPAGTYRAAARDFIEDGQWYDREFLEAAREGAAKIVLGEGASEAVTLKLPTPRR